MWKLQPLWKKSPPLSQEPPSKSWGPVKPPPTPFWKFGWRFNPSPPRWWWWWWWWWIVFVEWLTDSRSQLGPLSEILTIMNLQHAGNRKAGSHYVNVMSVYLSAFVDNCRLHGTQSLYSSYLINSMQVSFHAVIWPVWLIWHNLHLSLHVS